MDSELLEDFLELARELSFSRAAEMRSMTQPAFSRRIRALEETVGTALVHRTSRAVRLTPAGKTFQPHAATILRLITDAQAEALAAAGRAELTLNLAATHALSHRFVPGWLMHVAGPAGIGALSMVSDTQQQLAGQMLRGAADFLVCYGSSQMDISGLPPRHYRSHAIGRDLLVPLCARAADGSPLWSLDDALHDIPWITYGSASGLHHILEAAWKLQPQPRLEPRMSSVLATTNMEMARQGLGVSWLPLSLAGDLLANGSLVRAGGHRHDVPVNIVLYRPRARLSPHAEGFWQRAITASMQESHA